MAAKPKRPRAERRQADRDLEKARRDARKLYQLEPGGSADRPLVVTSPSQIEIDAASRPCPLCGGELRAGLHEVREVAGQRLRVAPLSCRSCRATFERFYRLGALLS